jgi:hypothetical protein
MVGTKTLPWLVISLTWDKSLVQPKVHCQHLVPFLGVRKVCRVTMDTGAEVAMMCVHRVDGLL